MDNNQFWALKVNNANDFYKQWSTKFKCDTLEQYYEGFQWKGRQDYITVNYNPYTLNLVYSTIKNKLANLLFQKPAFNIEAVPGATAKWNPDQAAQVAEVKEAVLNTLIQRRSANFVKQVKLSALDSFFRFGIMEVGYAADWRNPQKEDPLLSDHGEESSDNPDKKVKVVEQNDLPEAERIYFKRIPAKRFRVSVSDATELNDHDWCGYYQFYNTKTLRNTPGIKFPKDAPDTFITSADYNSISISGQSPKPEFLHLLSEGQITKVWHIFDMVDKTRKLLLDGSFETLWEKDCDRLPLSEVRWDDRLEGFYPLPPVFQWLTPQDEINESREQLRSFRRRFTRKFFVIENQVDELEIEKFASGPDGVIITIKKEGAIGEIPNAPINSATEESLAISKDDFNIVSGTSAEARGQATDRETATSAKITAAKAQIRESSEQMDFSGWICDVGRDTLICAKENLSLGLWARFSSNPSDQVSVLQDLQASGPIYQYINSQQLDDGYDFEITIDVMNQTPAAMAQAEQSFVSFLAMLTQFPMIAMSPLLIRKAALVCGLRDEKIIQQAQQVALLSMAAKAAQGANQNGQTLSQAGAAANAGKTEVAQMKSPTADQITSQLNSQVQ